MELVINIALLIDAALLVTSILLQAKGDGLGAAFGGGNNIASTRRGAEKGLFTLSIIFSAIFIGLTASHLFI